MQGEGLLAALPIWGIFIVTLLLVMFSVEGGYRWADYRQKRSKHEMEAPIGAMVGAMLGLLAFILGFTFSIAADTFHARKEAVVDEANAIRATYLLAELIPDPHRTEVRKILREYVEERLQWVGGKKVPVGRSAEELQKQLWAHTLIVGAQNLGEVDVFLESVKEVLYLQVEREILREQSRISGPFWAVLYMITVTALAAMGYHGGVAGTTRSPVMMAVAVAFSLVIVIIADLDRPGQGLIDVSQQAMMDLRNWMTEPQSQPSH